MSLASKITFGGSIIFASTVVSYVHWSKRKDRERMHEGVILDMQRQEAKKRQNIMMLEDQAKLTRILKDERRQDQENRANQIQDEENKR